MKKHRILLLTLFFITTTLSATKYYVNNASTANDVYCTAIGAGANNGLSPSTPKLTLASILTTYNASFAFGDTIFIDAGSYTEIQLSSPPNGVVIKGAGVLYTTITKSGSDRYFMLINDNNTVISDLKITGYDNQTVSGVQALGIANNTTGVKIINVQVDGSATSSTLGGYPIEVGSGVTALFSGGGATCNTWDAGGGMHIAGTTSTITIQNYQFIGNYQLWGNGTALKISGGVVNIYNTRFESNKIGGDKSGMGIDMTTGTVNVYDSYFYKNETNILANNIGGAVSIHGGSFRITRSVFMNNVPETATSGIYGAGIGVTGGVVFIDSCKFSGNVGARANDVYVSGGTVLSRNCIYGSAANQVGQAGVGTFSISSCGSPNKYGTVTSVDVLAPTYTASPTLPDYLPVTCISIPCTTPTITSSTPVSSICSGGTFTTNLSSTTTSAQTSYSWTSATVAGIIGHSTSGTGNINETLTNTGGSTLTVTYSVTPIFNLSCTGPVVIYSVSVFPSTSVTATSPTICSGHTATITPSGSTSYTIQPGNLVGTTFTFSPGSSSNYTISGAPMNGCPVVSNTVSITVNSNPTASISPSSTLTCSSSTISLSGSGGGTYSWSGPGIVSGGTSSTPTINLPGTYNLTVTAANSCTASTSVSVTQNTTAPTAGASNASTLTCATTTAQLTGTGGGTYSWSGPGTITNPTSSTPIVNTAGTYTVLVTAANGCTATATTAITQNTTAPTAGASNTSTLTCITTTAQLTGTGGGTYSWFGPGTITNPTSSTPIVNTAGTYTVLVTAANGCTATATTAITQNTTAPTVGASNTSTLTCTTTTAQLTGTGGGTYSWSGPGTITNPTSSTPIVNTAGTYTVLVTAANGCTATAATAITQNTTAPTPGASNASTLTCATTTAQLTGTGGGTYSWSGPGTITNPTSSTPIVNTAGTYTVLVTAANGCTATATASITQNTIVPVVSSTVSNTLTCSTITVNASATSTSTPVSYNWSGPGITSATNISTITVNQGGIYNYTVTNTSNGCKTTGTQSVTQNTTAPAATASLATVITCTSTSATLQGGPLTGVTYNWSGTGLTGATNQATATITSPGTYTLMTTSTANGCTNTAVVTPTANLTPPQVSVVPDLTINCASPTALLEGSSSTSGATFSWTGPTSGTPAGSTPTNSTSVVSAPGNYTLTVTNPANACTSSAVLAVTANFTAPGIVVSGTQTITCSAPTTTVAGGSGVSGITYSWNPGGTAPTSSVTTVSSPGNYTLTITNPVNSCTNSAVVSVVQNTLTPFVSTSTPSVLNCTLTSVNASATTTTTPVTYNWSGAGITSATNISTITVNQGGTYNYTVTNTSNGCIATGTVAVTQNTTAPNATATGGTLTCANTSTTLVGGPASGVTYSWTGAGLTGTTNLANATATATGSYTLTTTSTANGCTNTAVATVTNNLATPTANAGTTQTLVCGVSSVTLTGSATPTTSTANWLGGVTSPNSFTTTVGAPGTYTLVVTHPTSGCTSTSTVAVSSSTDVPQATVNAITNSITCTNSVVAIGVTLSNTDPVSYTWTGPGLSGANNTATTTATVAGTYSVTITNTVSNCQSNFNVVVPTNTNNPTTTASSSNTITCSTTSITVSATPTGTNYGYAWSGPGTITNGSTANPSIDQGGVYTVTVTDNINGCTGAATVAVQSNTTVPTLTLTPSTLTTTCANPTATVLATSSADPDANYTWTAPSTGSLNNTNTNNPVATGSGVFTVQVTNTVSGCVSAVTTITMSADANTPTLTATASSTILCSGQTTTLSITGADSYTWSTMESTNTITVSPTTTTTYTATGTNTTTGCSNIANITINVTPTPTIGITASTTTICAGNTTTLTLTGATNYTVTSPSQTTTNTVVLSPTVQTTYTITGEQQGCASTTETITIDVNQLPTIATTNTVTCAGSPVTLTATGADTYNWQPTGATTNTTTVSPSTNTTYTVTGTNTLTGCTSTLSTVDVTVNQLPTVTASSNPNTTCTSGTINLTANTTATSYTWTTGNGVDNTNQNNQTVTFPASNLTTGTYTYTVTVTDANGCVSPQATTTVSIIDVPNANFDLSDLTICQNENGTLSINTPQTGVTYDWNINGQTITNTNPLTVPSTITNTSGIYTVSVLASIGTCTNTAANNFTVNALPTVALINPIVSACENTTAQLDVASPNSAYTYNWTNGTNNGTGANLTVNPLTQSTQGEYTVTVTDQNGCTNRTTGKIDIKLCETYVPEFFSPNGDGKNDGFVIKNIENYPNNQLKIFNRWGNLVYQKDGYQNEFEGYANTGDQVGKSKLPAGTYYVILVYGDEKTETYNGILQLQY